MKKTRYLSVLSTVCLMLLLFTFGCTKTLTVAEDGKRVNAGEATMATAVKDTATASADKDATVSFKNIHFNLDEAVISDGDKALLKEYATMFKAMKGKKLVIEGYCDERGSAEYNLALGQRRADAVAKYLVALGVSQELISTISYGIEKPLDTASTEEAWAKNRRAQFLIK